MEIAYPQMKILWLRGAAAALMLCSGTTAHAGPTPAEGYTSHRISVDRKYSEGAVASWAVALAAGARTFGGREMIPGHPESSPIGVSLQAEYMLPFLPRLGSLGLGPSLALYPSAPGRDSGGHFPSWSIGGQARYQARFSEFQIVVPTVGYHLERMHYVFGDQPAGNLWLSGPTLGAELSLNALDRKRAAEFYALSGIYRTYFVLESRLVRGEDRVVSASGLSWYAGLRFEM
jgi:hypothetical protein